VLQLWLAQDEHPEDPLEGVKLPLLLKAQVDISLSRLVPLHLGQLTLSFDPSTSASKSLSHSLHLNSYIGI
jgi:hypothetical protein